MSLPPPASVPPPPNTTNPITRDPVRWAQVLATFVGTIVTVFLAVDIIDQVWAAVIVGVMTASNAAIQELFVRPETVPRIPLEEIARIQRQ